MSDLVREWLRRYGPAEGLSLAATLAAAGVAQGVGYGLVGIALAATWGGNIAYFGYLLLLDAALARRTVRGRGEAYSWRTLGRNLRALAVEFGLAEVLDSLLIRPALMVVVPRLVGSLALGIMLAKLLADVTFYIPAIIGYELSKKRLREF